MKAQPKVSIGMPVYNGERFVRSALDSLLAQVFNDFELIVSDNASTDSTESICREYMSRDKRIRYVRQRENIGSIANFQFVLSEASGDYFMWAAADDRRDPRFLSMAVDVLDSDVRVGLVFSDMITENLITGARESSSCGFTDSRRKFFKYLFRLQSSCPSLIYGLHRRHLLQDAPFLKFDYSDVHLTHWYELNSVIKTIPLPLYVAGTNGIRLPYSLTGGDISTKCFVRMEYRMLREHFSFFAACLLVGVASFLISKNTKTLNAFRRKHLSSNMLEV